MRLLSLNLGGISDAYGSWANRAARIGQLIGEERVDVLVAQAAPLGDHGRFAPDLHMLMPGHDHVALAVPHSSVAEPTGMAIVSMAPIVRVEEVALSRQDGEDPFNRKLLAVHLPDAALTIVDAHFSWVDAQARANGREALAFVAGLQGDVLLIGDMNQPHDSPAMRMIADAGFVDCWVRQNTDASGGDGFTFESGKLWGRIDYVWERTQSPRVTSMRTVGGAGGEALSDHLGLIVDLT